MQPRCPAPLHHLIVPLHIARDVDDLSAPALPRIFEQLHAIRASAPLLRVPQDHSLRLDVLPDQPCDRGTKGSFLIRANPDQEPIGALDAGGECRADASAGADADAAFVHCRGVAYASCGEKALATCQTLICK